MDISKISNLGWEAKVSLIDGIKKTIEEVSSNF
jgi:nucleoside-diphosphate-sugar epimerase